jgi:DNA-binding NarL/FixJ family response regulator
MTRARPSYKREPGKAAVVIVEYQLMFRELFAEACSAMSEFCVVGVASTGTEAKRLIGARRPDIVVLDVHLPGTDGFEVAAYVRECWPRVKIVMTSSHCNDYTLYKVERARIHGFIDKNLQSMGAFRNALAAVQRDEAYFSRSFHEARKARARNSRDFTKILSEREFEVLELIGQSLSDQEVAAQLGISPATVQTHRSKILRKLKIPNSNKLARFALEHGFSRIVTLRNGRPVYS